MIKILETKDHWVEVPAKIVAKKENYPRGCTIEFYKNWSGLNADYRAGERVSMPGYAVSGPQEPFCDAAEHRWNPNSTHVSARSLGTVKTTQCTNCLAVRVIQVDEEGNTYYTIVQGDTVL